MLSSVLVDGDALRLDQSCERANSVDDWLCPRSVVDVELLAAQSAECWNGIDDVPDATRMKAVHGFYCSTSAAEIQGAFSAHTL